VTIRLATIGDAEPIMAIYNHEVLTSTATFDLVPRSLDEQAAWIGERTGAFGAIVAADESGAVLGFGALSPYKERAAYRTSVEDSVYVERNCQGRGVGRLIVTELVSIAQLSGFHTVFARIEAGGAASRGLHAACGFELVGIEREVGRKFHRWLDVAIMQRMV
jgi:phosphinothricin acetyltransferase